MTLSLYIARRFLTMFLRIVAAFGGMRRSLVKQPNSKGEFYVELQ